MTPQEKSIELTNKFIKTGMMLMQSKQCALISVEEVLNSHYKLMTGINPTTYRFWQDVKLEIEKL